MQVRLLQTSNEITSVCAVDQLDHILGHSECVLQAGVRAAVSFPIHLAHLRSVSEDKEEQACSLSVTTTIMTCTNCTSTLFWYSKVNSLTLGILNEI